MNVQTLLIAITLPLVLSGCGSFGWRGVEPLEIQKRAVERAPLNLPDPTPPRAREIEWIIVTPDNAAAVWQRLRDTNTDVVVFGLSDDGYETLAVTMAELRNFIAQQRGIIIKYREYYEPKPPATDTKQ